MLTTFVYILEDPRSFEIRYVGKSNNPKKRLEGHLGDKRKTHKTNWIQSLKKQGLRPIVEIIDEVYKNEWQFWEKHYISLYKSWGFNLTNHSEGGEGGIEHLEATREKIRQAKLGKPSKKKGKKMPIELYEKHVKQCRKRLEGKTYEELHGIKKGQELRLEAKERREGKTYEEIYGDRAKEILNKQSKAHIGKPGLKREANPNWGGKSFTKETIEKMKTRSQKEAPLNRERFGKKIFQYDKNLKLVQKWPSIAYAAKCCNLHACVIQRILDQLHRSHGNFIWTTKVIE